ncbi:NADP-dependent malic enzyme 4 chloroplastic-like, partial [Trifolium medium]|nr:NADP-dependent malic enzyme 4 chloroplastic-like [Trifolium medium]
MDLFSGNSISGPCRTCFGSEIGWGKLGRASVLIPWCWRGTGIAELIALEISKRTNSQLEEVRKNIWLVDSKGLIVSSRKESLQHFKKPWAHDHEPVTELVDAVNQIKPTVLIGTSGQGRTFTQEVIKAMASINE